MLLEDAKVETLRKLTEGSHCPCCGQFAKEYKRKLNTGMALCLVNLYKLGKWEEYHHISKIFVGHPGDFAKLKYYGFIVEEVNMNTTTRTSGMWRITDEGRRFILRERTANSHFKVYNSEFRGFEGDQIDIIEALGEKFNYAELMAA